MKNFHKKIKVYKDINILNVANSKINNIEKIEDSVNVLGKRKKNKFLLILQTTKIVKDLVFMSFMQIIFLGILIFLMERFYLYYLYVTTYSHVFFITELSITFFFLFLIIDFITECISRMINKIFLIRSKRYNSHKFLLISIIFESFLQTIIFIIINTILQSYGIFGVNIRKSDGSKSSIEFFYSLVFIAVFMVECLSEELNLIFDKIKDRSS